MPLLLCLYQSDSGLPFRWNLLSVLLPPLEASLASSHFPSPTFSTISSVNQNLILFSKLLAQLTSHPSPCGLWYFLLDSLHRGWTFHPGSSFTIEMVGYLQRLPGCPTSRAIPRAGSISHLSPALLCESWTKFQLSPVSVICDVLLQTNIYACPWVVRLARKLNWN